MEKDVFGEYMPEKIEYMPYNGQDALEIITPTEINISFSEKHPYRRKLSSFVYNTYINTFVGNLSYKVT